MPRTLLATLLDTSQRRARLLVAITSGLGLLATLSVAQYAVDQRARDRVDQRNLTVLNRAADIAERSTDVLARALALRVRPCSREDLLELRIMAFESRFVRDVARIQRGAVRCTAAWGVLDAPMALPPPHSARGAYRFWKDMPTSQTPRIRADLMATGDVMVTTAPGAFDGIEAVGEAAASLVVNREGTYVFQQFGDGQALLQQWRAHQGGGHEAYIASRCDARHALCALSSTPRAYVWHEPWWLLLGLTLLGTLSGAAIGLLLRGYLERRRLLPAQLARAIRSETLGVVYQPIRHLGDRRLVGVEALARWRNEDDEPVAPLEFIPIAEHKGLLDALTRLVLRRVMADLGPRLRAPTPFYTSVNVAPAQLADARFRTFLMALVEQHGVAPSRIALEITERSTTGLSTLAEPLAELRRLGFRIMVDDFGTGYSNFAYLTELPLDAIKMDRAFTRAIGARSVASQVIQGITTMAEALQVQLIVEGIETEEEGEFILALAPTANGQGWLLGRPVVAAELAQD